MSSQRPNKPTDAAPPPMFGFRPGGRMGMFGEVQKSKNVRGTVMRLWIYIQRRRWVLFATFVLVFITTIVSLIGPYLMGRAIDGFISLPATCRAGCGCWA
jgi:ATP-binding cassette, subfamily B, multidrug efflux pump